MPLPLLCGLVLVACSDGTGSASSTSAATETSGSTGISATTTTGDGGAMSGTTGTVDTTGAANASGPVGGATGSLGGAGGTTAMSDTTQTTSGTGDTTMGGAAAGFTGMGGTIAGSAGMGGATTTGSAGTGGVGDDQDALPPRPLDVTAAEGRHEHTFRAADADPEVSFNDNDQVALFDNRAATLMGKLVLTFGGAGETKGNLTGGGEFCGRRGFHVLGVAAFQDYDIVSYGPDFFGEARRSVFEGVMHTRLDAFANIELTPADGVAQRTQKGLQYLHAMYPEEDWGYYLQEDGSVRWSDVIFTGMSHGASSSARFAFLVRASRVVSMAGPRDNLCQRVDLNDCGGDVATWFDEIPKTPIDRFYAVTGTDDSQHTQHLFAMEKLGYLGEPTAINGAEPPYGDSHRLVASAGHEDLCAQSAYQDACNYAFGVPPENQAGTGP